MNKGTHRMTQATEFIQQRYSYKRKSGLGKSRSWRWSCGTHVTASQAEQLQMRGMNSYRLIFNLFREMSRVANNGLFSKPKRIFASQTNFKNINAVLGLDNSLQFSSWISKKYLLSWNAWNQQDSSLKKAVSKSREFIFYKLRIIHNFCHSKNVCAIKYH